MSESLLLILSLHFLNEGSMLGHYMASAACGLQNAMTSTYSGAVVRTTHLQVCLPISELPWACGREGNRRIKLVMNYNDDQANDEKTVYIRWHTFP